MVALFIIIIGGDMMFNFYNKRKLKKQQKEMQKKLERQERIRSTVRFAQLLKDTYSTKQAVGIIALLDNKDLLKAYTLLCATDSIDKN